MAGWGSTESEKRRTEGSGMSGEEREASQVFFSTEAEKSTGTTEREDGHSFQHRDSGQRLSGSGKGPAIGFSTRIADSSRRAPGAGLVFAPGPGRAPQVTGEPLYPDGGTEGGLRCLTLPETYRSVNGLFNALFSRRHETTEKSATLNR